MGFSAEEESTSSEPSTHTNFAVPSLSSTSLPFVKIVASVKNKMSNTDRKYTREELVQLNPVKLRGADPGRLVMKMLSGMLRDRRNDEITKESPNTEKNQNTERQFLQRDAAIQSEQSLRESTCGTEITPTVVNEEDWLITL
ncbi:hypothetical protein QR680_000395 [Steinernema hermaphroditum]|uniref:Uncharacterized protein n=1 Tax=Steinernema hermaphroditum TaxID=289476 RepID=A0AA39GUF6_9BILA|nr:hypothetical protein QR680_000395 [Steinernema hermaphroditum]